MIIANPIYDVVFKRLMENEKVAKFFISTLLDQNIESVEVKPQEYTYEGEFDFTNPLDVEKYEKRLRERYSIWVYRLDFIATIKTDTGEYKKILIEIQKAKNETDLMRFRNYLANQYKREDIINGEKVALPITTIYILGFSLPEITTPCVKIERNYKDLIHKKTLEIKSEFIEKLTHDSYIVQVLRITGVYATKLDKLLSVFEQNNFYDEDKIVKEFTHITDIEELKIITDILHYSGTNPAEKKRIEDEQEAIRTINELFAGREKKFAKEMLEKEIELKEKNKALSEKDQALNENAKALNENAIALNEKDQALADLKKQMEELMKRLK